MWDEVDLQVVLVANSLPALNDVTAMELPDIVAEAAKVSLLQYIVLISYAFSCLPPLKIIKRAEVFEYYHARNFI